MKVGIITWFHYENYGTALQAYALHSVVKTIGNECILLNYIPGTNNIINIKVGLKKYIKNKIDNILYKYLRRRYKYDFFKKKESFKRFINSNCILSEKLNNKKSLYDLNNSIDVFICGSDQIWTTNPLDGTYYLNFVLDDKKKISYAPSFGVNNISSEKQDLVKEWLSKFNRLSVREEQGAKIIKELTGRDSNVVLDPTFLISTTQWDSIAAKVEINKPYILCYFLGNRRSYWSTVDNIRRLTGYNVVTIPIRPQAFFLKGQIFPCAGPEEFVWLIKNAHIVLTDSFHAVAFSIMYKRDFFVFKRFDDKEENSQNSRIYNILKLFHLESRIIDDNNAVLKENIKIKNYDNVLNKLNTERNKSMLFLKHSLSG